MEFQRERGVAGTIQFPMIKAGETNFAVTGDWTPATGDAKVSLTGGSVGNATNLPSAVGGAGSVLWTWTYTATEADTDSLTLQLVDSATKAVEDNAHSINFRLGGTITASQGIIVSQVDNTAFTATSTILEANRIAPNTTEGPSADMFNGTLIKFVSGNVRGTVTPVTDYSLTGGRERYTYTAIFAAPDDTSKFIVL